MQLNPSKTCTMNVSLSRTDYPHIHHFFYVELLWKCQAPLNSWVSLWIIGSHLRSRYVTWLLLSHKRLEYYVSAAGLLVEMMLLLDLFMHLQMHKKMFLSKMPKYCTGAMMESNENRQSQLDHFHQKYLLCQI